MMVMRWLLVVIDEVPTGSMSTSSPQAGVRAGRADDDAGVLGETRAAVEGQQGGQPLPDAAVEGPAAARGHGELAVAAGNRRGLRGLVGVAVRTQVSAVAVRGRALWRRTPKDRRRRCSAR